MKAGGKKLGASKKQPCTGCGDKGISNYMKGKADSKAAFVKLGNTKYASNPSRSKMQKGGSVKKK
jgi:hypothetical protein